MSLKFGLKTYLTIATLLVSGLPIILFILWPYSSIDEKRLEEVEEKHFLIAKGIAASLGRYRDSLEIAMETLATAWTVGRSIETLPDIGGIDFYNVCVVRKSDGAVVEGFSSDAFPCPSQLTEKDLSTSLEVVDATETQFTGVTSVNGLPRFYAIVDLGDHFLQGAFPTTSLKDMLSHFEFGLNGYAVILDRNGQVIAHPSVDLEKDNEDFSSLPIVQAIMTGRAGVMAFYSPYADKDLIGGYTSVPDANWGVMVVQPVSELKEATAKLYQEIGLVIALEFAASILIAFFLARGFERRIKGIQSVVASVAEGNQNITFEDSKNPIEISEFNSMETGISTIIRRIRANEGRYRNLFDNVPVASREEDLSGLKVRVDALKLPNLDALEAYLDQHPEFIVECGKSIQVVDANAKSLELHGARDIEDMNSNALSDFHEGSMKFLREAIVATFEGKTQGTRETTITSISGEVRHLIATWCVLPGYETDFSRSLMTSIDITEKIEAEAALHHAQKLEAVGQLTGGVAHDFNNLLTVMGGNAELLALDPKHDTDLVNPIMNAVKRGAELTQSLLAFSRKQALQPRRINITQLGAETGKTLRRTLGTNIEVRIVPAPEPLFVHADAGQVEAAFLNLAINARDAMPNGGILELEFRAASPLDTEGLALMPGRYVVCSITDNGEGMNAETLSHAFEPFYTTKEVGKGSGLGLSMIYGFAKQSNGAAKIESTLGKGTVVKLFLPASVDVPNEMVFLDQGSALSNEGGLRILVLEDEPDVLAYLEKILRELGHSVLVASTIDAAWQIVDDGAKIDLVMSDVLLPGPEKGTDFARELRLRTPSCPFIFISGYPSSDHVECVDSKTEWLIKPFTSHDLVEKIERVCIAEIDRTDGQSQTA